MHNRSNPSSSSAAIFFWPISQEPLILVQINFFWKGSTLFFFSFENLSYFGMYGFMEVWNTFSRVYDQGNIRNEPRSKNSEKKKKKAYKINTL